MGTTTSADLFHRQVRFRGRLLRVEVDRVREPDGEGGYGPLSRREVARHPGAVAVLARPDPGRLVMVRQYRYAAGRPMLEIPAGTREAGEAAEETAARELAEETGYRAAVLRPFGAFFTAPGFCDEYLRVFLAEGLTAGPPAPESGESVRPVLVPVAEARRMLAGETGPHGHIEDAKTLAALGRFFATEEGGS